MNRVASQCSLQQRTFEGATKSSNSGIARRDRRERSFWRPIWRSWKHGGSRQARPRIAPDLRSQLLAEYTPDLARLAPLIERDLSVWNRAAALAASNPQL